jgi:hypothetical protein
MEGKVQEIQTQKIQSLEKEIGASGTMCIMKRHNKWYLLLIKDYDGTYNDFGGIYKDWKTIAGSAIAETREESRGVIILKEKELDKYVDCISPWGNYYRCYLVVLPYDHYNVKYHSIDRKKLPKHYQETTDMQIFSLENVIKESKEGKDSWTTILGKSVLTNTRLQKVMRAMISEDFFGKLN